MKGWIKVHESSLDRDAYIQVSRISTVYEDTDEAVAYIVSGSDHIPVEETVDEVLALIKEAEKPADTEEE